MGSLKSNRVLRPEQPCWLRSKRKEREKDQMTSVLPPPEASITREPYSGTLEVYTFKYGQN